MDIFVIVAQLAIMGGIFYFFLIRPENKRRKNLSQMQGNLNKGDRVVTVGGLRARVHSINEKSITLITDEGVKLNFNRTAVTQKID